MQTGHGIGIRALTIQSIINIMVGIGRIGMMIATTMAGIGVRATMVGIGVIATMVRLGVTTPKQDLIITMQMCLSLNLGTNGGNG